MSPLTSTVPGAMSTLLSHLTAVVTANPTLGASAYLGLPVANVTDNYLAIGQWPTGALLHSYKQDFMGMPAKSGRKDEDYVLPCHLRAWAGDSTPTARLADAFTMLDGVLTRLQADPQGTTALSSSGTWQVDVVEIPESGPFTNKGWGVLVTFTVHVFNVRIPSY